MMDRSDLHCNVWCEYDSQEVEIVDFLGGKLAAFSSRCPTRETSPNEDSACVIEVAENRGVFAVADGVGGAARGNDASKRIIENLAEACFELELDEGHQLRGLRGEVIDAIEIANREILSWADGAGTTLTAIELDRNEFRYFHVGDSGAILTSNRGRIKFATVGHAPVAQAVAIGILDSEEALSHEDQNLITNCLGSRELKIEVGIFQPISSRDTLLIASDGLFDNLTSQEIAEIIRKGDLEEQTRQLTETALARMQSAEGKPDDLTVICWRP